MKVVTSVFIRTPRRWRQSSDNIKITFIYSTEKALPRNIYDASMGDEVLGNGLKVRGTVGLAEWITFICFSGPST